jgi:RNA polymerase sigma-70 factor (ECF subfamily)
MEDAEIVALYWARNEDAIAQTKSKYGAYLNKVAYNILSDLEDSQECVSDTLLAAWRSMPDNRPRNLRTYLGKITRQVSIDLYRRRNRMKRYASEYAISLEELGDSFSDGKTPEDELDARLLTEAVNRFLRTLPDEARNTFIGRYYFFDSVKNVARYCGMSESKCKSMLYRTRQSLKAYLQKEGFDL